MSLLPRYSPRGNIDNAFFASSTDYTYCKMGYDDFSLGALLNFGMVAVICSLSMVFYVRVNGQGIYLDIRNANS
jgi:hypothetical protein